MMWHPAKLATSTISFILLYITLFIDIALAGPSTTLPINAQVPPVARVDQPFRFTFSASTFTSILSIDYSLVAAPSWLQLDGPSRTLSGTPKAQDNGSCAFELVARDGTGTTPMPVTLVVVDTPGPAINVPLEDQLRRLEGFSYPDTLIVRPGSAISLNFDQETFNNTDRGTQYYATCANNTPLPSWLQFDPQQLALAGSTPLFDSPSELPQNIPITLTASNVAGFADATTTFSLYISNHQLSFGTSALTIDVTPGQQVDFGRLKDALDLDGQTILGPELKSVSANPPEWLHLDAQSLSLRGKAPDDVPAESFDVSVEDVFGDVANATIFLNADSSAEPIFGTIGPLTAKIGTHFDYTLPQIASLPPDAVVNIDLGEMSSWLTFNNKSMVLSGNVPDLRPHGEDLNLTVTEGSKTASQLIRLEISFGASPTGDGQAPPPASPTTGSAPLPTTQPLRDGSDESGYNSQRIAAEIVIPVLGTALLLFVAWLWWRRRKQKQDENARIEKLEIGRPLRPPSIDSMMTVRRDRQSDAPRLELARAGGDATRRDSGTGSLDRRLPMVDRSSKHESIVNFFQRTITPINFDSASRRDRGSIQAQANIEAEDRLGHKGSFVQSKPQKLGALKENSLAPTRKHTRSSKRRSFQSQVSSLFNPPTFRGRGHGAGSRGLPSLDLIAGDPRPGSALNPFLGLHHNSGTLGQDSGPPPSNVINFSKFTGPKAEGAEASGESQADSDSFSPTGFQFPRPATAGGALGAPSTIRKVSATPTPCSTPPDLSVPRKRPSGPPSSRSSNYTHSGKVSSPRSSSAPSAPIPPPRNPRRIVGTRADRTSSLGWSASSTRGSTARKGAMMQNPGAVLSGPSSRYSPWPSGSTGAGALGVGPALGRPPRLGRFRSRSSAASSQRYADAAEDGESLERQSRSTGVEGEVEHGEDLVLAGGRSAEGGVDRRWERSESPSVLVAYGTGKDAWKARVGGLESGQGVVAGVSASKEERGVLLGEVGKKEVSVSPGIRGSKSFEGEKAFL